jgi:glycosyltransferase involved in cell wall biosynthesis
MHQVTTIVPAYNESGSIGNVLAVLAQVSELAAILVIDDGSTDATLDEMNRAAALDKRIQVLQMPTNSGKGQAVLAAVALTRTPYVLMLDADLMNLQRHHVLELISPVTADKADMTLGLFRGGHFGTDVSHWATPWLTGQRCMRAELLRFLTKEMALGYGLEIALTVEAQLHDYRVQRVAMHGVWHPTSEYHRGLWRALGWRRRMYRQIWDSWRATGGPAALRIYVTRSLTRFWSDPLGAWPAARKRLTELKDRLRESG